MMMNDDPLVKVFSQTEMIDNLMGSSGGGLIILKDKDTNQYLQTWFGNIIELVGIMESTKIDMMKQIKNPTGLITPKGTLV
jgi:hypothetical protein